MAAIAETKTPDETLRELILQCFAVLEDEPIRDEHTLVDAMYALFGLTLPAHEVQAALRGLQAAGLINTSPGGYLALPIETRAALQTRIDEARALEDRVRQAWIEELAQHSPTLPADDLWKALRAYLSRAFRRHGMQTVALLDASIDMAPEHAESLSTLLDQALDQTSVTHQPAARAAISHFLASVGRYPDRARYIAQLADGAFNYCSLMVPPDVAAQLRRELSRLTLFLDTNFLFGILGLHVHPQVAVSNDLVRAVNRYDFPYRLRYHQATDQELRAAIDYYGQQLRHPWPLALSRAAITSPYLSGIELRYHQERVETGIDVESFLAPYKHVDVLLKEKGIAIFRSRADRQTEQAALYAEYSQYLQRKGRIKPHEAIDHDTIVLDAVRHMRSNASSSLDAGALLVTCDYSLYSFDWESSRDSGQMACTLLPNLLWQILRPFVPSDAHFDQSFAETFAIPEFRVIGSGASKAASKMLHILAGYKDLSEPTAARMLSNDLLMRQLRAANNDEEFQRIVESGIVAENNALLEEKAQLARQLQRERAERAQEAAQPTVAAQEPRAAVPAAPPTASNDSTAGPLPGTDFHQDTPSPPSDPESAALRVALRRTRIASAVSAAAVLAFVLVTHFASLPWLVSHPNAILIQVALAAGLVFAIVGLLYPSLRSWCWLVGVAAALATTTYISSRTAVSKLLSYGTVAFAVVATLSAFELLVHRTRWRWIALHQHSYAIQAGTCLTLVLATVGLLLPAYRAWCWGVGVFAFVVVVVQLLGGPRSTGATPSQPSVNR